MEIIPYNNLRQASQFKVLHVSTVFNRSRSVSFFWSQIWESIPSERMKSSSFSLFKKKIKRWKPQEYAEYDALAEYANITYLALASQTFGN